MKTCIKNLLLLPALIAGLGLIPADRVTAQTFTSLYGFTAATPPDIAATPSSPNSDGAYPSAGLILSGNTLYGTAYYGGSSGLGTVFAVNIGGTGFTTLHSFTGTFGPSANSDGAFPAAGLILSGNTLYGTAKYGGSSGRGMVFAVNTDGTGFTNLHSFTGTFGPSANSDGAFPNALILSGNALYGTTYNGGISGNGTMFAVNTNGTGFTTLHSFNYADVNNGGNPQAGLTLSGNTLYGTTFQGGSSGRGTVFAANTDGTGYMILHSFTAGVNDGGDPNGVLILSGNTLYGPALNGGSPGITNDFAGKGAVFAVNTDGTGFVILHFFTGGSDGAHPTGLILSGNTLYGTAASGGSAGAGTVFAVNPDGTGFTNLHTFNGGSDGSQPVAGLILSGNTLYGTAHNGGSSGAGTVFSLSLPVPPPAAPAITAQPASQTVNVWQNASFTVTATGTALSYQWRKDGTNLSGATNATYSVTGVQTNQAGSYTVMVSNAGGSVTSAPPAVLVVNPASPDTVVAWGLNNSGQTIVPAGLSGVTAIAAGYYHTVALKSDGTVIAWGLNNYGQTNVPADLSGVRAIAAGYYHTVALKNDGTVVAWGNNGNGQTNVPAGLNGVRAIAAGYYHTVALKNDGTLVAWGLNNYGQTNVPAGLSGVTAIAAGGYHTAALQNDGTVVAWGRNVFGQTTVPTGLSGVTAIAAGDFHTVALKSDGTVVAWGLNNYGQTTVPTGLSGVTAIAAGDFHTVALKSDGTVVAWGNNGDGQTTIPAGLSGVTAIAAGGNHTVVLLGTASAIVPTITTTSTGNNLTLRWPDSAKGYRVESALNLTPPIAWSNVTGTFQTNGGSISIVLPITGAQKFFRLVTP